MISEALQWLAFGMAVLSVFCYGNSKVGGAFMGLATSIVFIVWGATTLQHAAWAANVVFFIAHTRNLYIGWKERNA